ncbi:hypothetical protein QBC43DRAFT_344903 [Cladorrhinum sp. PSN259]|nr:hypothetical protein QBC43DRAFT_344903 [Cladorrhinum sp. PSN259]
MRFSTAVTSGLVLGLAQAISLDGELIRDDGCVNDALHECFTQSLAQASSYCTASILTAATITQVATVTPTVTITEQVTATVTERTDRDVKKIRIRKRGICGKLPLACLRNLGAFQPPELSSACSCIGVTTATSTEFGTATATEAATEIFTEVATVTTLEVVFSTHAPEPESTTSEEVTSSTAEPEESSTEAPGSSTAETEPTTTSTFTSTVAPTSTEAPSSTSEAPASTSSPAPPPPLPVVTNGDFQTGTLEGWSVISRIGSASGSTVKAIPYGDNQNYVMEITATFFTSKATAAVVVGQTLACEAGKLYMLSFQYTVVAVSNYNNGGPWSVVFGQTTVTSGAGDLVPWTHQSFRFTCDASNAMNSLQFRVQSGFARAVGFMVDNITVTPV